MAVLWCCEAGDVQAASALAWCSCQGPRPVDAPGSLLYTGSLEGLCCPTKVRILLADLSQEFSG